MDKVFGVISSAALGTVLGRFKPSLGNVVAGLSYAVLGMGGGLFVAGLAVKWWLSDRGGPGFSVMDHVQYGGAVLLGISTAVWGLHWMRGVWERSSREAELCEKGLRYRRGAVVTEVLWSEVASVRETQWRYWFRRDHPAPGESGTSYTVITRSGAEFGFDGDSVGEIKRFGELLRKCATTAQVAWETKRRG